MLVASDATSGTVSASLEQVAVTSILSRASFLAKMCALKKSLSLMGSLLSLTSHVPTGAEEADSSSAESG
jgi:hypothetical protein